MFKTLGIDSSLTGTGLCGLDDESGPLARYQVTVSHPPSVVGMERIWSIVSAIAAIVDEWKPDLIVMEEYAINAANTSCLTRLAELGGAIKVDCHQRGYEMGYGTWRNKLEKERAWVSTRSAAKLFVSQPRMSMTKFILGRGNIVKDPGKIDVYLAEVARCTGHQFPDDNQADAYMHAMMASMLVGVTRGKMPISNLLEHQQASLLDRVRPKGMSLRKALKLSDDEKLKLLQL